MTASAPHPSSFHHPRIDELPERFSRQEAIIIVDFQRRTANSVTDMDWRFELERFYQAEEA